MPTEQHLLPPNATPFERAASLTTARIWQVPVPTRDLLNPQLCPWYLLPYLAWALSIDRWKSDWSEAQKRTEVARAIELQRLKGTPASVEQVLASFDPLIQLIEWFDMEPRGEPHTFRVVIPLDGSPVPRSTAPFAQEIVRDIYRIKPARSHFELVLQLAVDAALVLTGGAWAMSYARAEATATLPATDDVALTEDGHALIAEDGELLEFD
ncbi:MAG: phage tail protein I [Sphingomonadales bacterium 63-6]|nr:MAG: phage tail protein I [Sphingomonadales bacterium 63-6]